MTITVTISGDSQSVRLHRAVLASLPARFQPTAAAADVQLVPTDVADWPRIVDDHLRSRKAVMLSGPARADANVLDQLADRADEAGTVVQLSRAYGADHTWIEAADSIRATANDAAIVESVAAVPDASQLDTAALEQVALFTALLPHWGSVGEVHRSSRHRLCAGQVNGVAVSFATVVAPTRTSTLTLDVVAAIRRWKVRWCADPHASPTQVACLDADGSMIRSLRYESGHRSSWIELHTRLTRQPQSGFGAHLRELAADLRVLERIETS